jgi:hypothetical protein
VVGWEKKGKRGVEGTEVVTAGVPRTLCKRVVTVDFQNKNFRQ